MYFSCVAMVMKLVRFYYDMIFMIMIFSFCAHHAEWNMSAVLQQAEESVHFPKELRNMRTFLGNPR